MNAKPNLRWVLVFGAIAVSLLAVTVLWFDDRPFVAFILALAFGAAVGLCYDATASYLQQRRVWRDGLRREVLVRAMRGER